jgi:hypothetical protein
MADYRIGLDIGNKEDMDCVALQNVETNEVTSYYALKDIEKHDQKIRAEERKKVYNELALGLVEFSGDFTMTRDEILNWLQKQKEKNKGRN